MSTTTHITCINYLLDLTSYAGGHVNDFDMVRVHADYVSLLNSDLPDGITLYRNGDVIAELDQANYAHDIDWNEFTNAHDVAVLFERHDRTAAGAPEHS